MWWQLTRPVIGCNILSTPSDTQKIYPVEGYKTYMYFSDVGKIAYVLYICTWVIKDHRANKNQTGMSLKRYWEYRCMRAELLTRPGSSTIIDVMQSGCDAIKTCPTKILVYINFFWWPVLPTTPPTTLASSHRLGGRCDSALFIMSLCTTTIFTKTFKKIVMKMGLSIYKAVKKIFAVVTISCSKHGREVHFLQFRV